MASSSSAVSEFGKLTRRVSGLSIGSVVPSGADIRRRDASTGQSWSGTDEQLTAFRIFAGHLATAELQRGPYGRDVMVTTLKNVSSATYVHQSPSTSEEPATVAAAALRTEGLSTVLSRIKGDIKVVIPASAWKAWQIGVPVVVIGQPASQTGLRSSQKVVLDRGWYVVLEMEASTRRRPKTVMPYLKRAASKLSPSYASSTAQAGRPGSFLPSIRNIAILQQSAPPVTKPVMSARDRKRAAIAVQSQAGSSSQAPRDTQQRRLPSPFPAVVPIRQQ